MNKFLISICFAGIIIGNVYTSEENWSEKVQQKKHKEQILAMEANHLYDDNAKNKFCTKTLDPNLTIKENINKLNLKPIYVKDLAEAKEFIKKIADTDKDYITKQIEGDKVLSTYKICEESPFYVEDDTVKKETVEGVDIIVKFSKIGLSNMKAFNYITFSETENNKNQKIKFEADNIIFIDENIDLEKVELKNLQIRIIHGIISNDTIKNVVISHNKNIGERELPLEKKNSNKQTSLGKLIKVNANKVEIRLGNKYYFYDRFDEKIVEVFLYKITKEKTTNTRIYVLTTFADGTGYNYCLDDIDVLFETFDECFEYTLDEFRTDLIFNSKRPTRTELEHAIPDKYVE